MSGTHLIELADVLAEPVRWLWPDHIPSGRMTLWDGYPSAGKTATALDLAARLSAGTRWPDGTPVGEPGGVLILAHEDDPGDTIRPRLEAAGADLSRIAIIDTIGGKLPRLPRDLAAIRRLLESRAVRLLILDPVSQYLDAPPASEQATRAALAPLLRACRELNTTLIGIRHPTKSGRGPAQYRGAGSTALPALARATYLLGASPDDEDLSVLAAAKYNLGPMPRSLTYRIVADDLGRARVDWLGTSETTAEDLAMGAALDRTALGEARDWLRGMLATGPKAAAELRHTANAEGVAWATVRRAQDALGIKPQRIGKKWIWALTIDDARHHPFDDEDQAAA